jgi:hypothetical protein
LKLGIEATLEAQEISEIKNNTPTVEKDHKIRIDDKLYTEGTDLSYGNTQRVTKNQFIARMIAKGKSRETATKMWNDGPPIKGKKNGGKVKFVAKGQSPASKNVEKALGPQKSKQVNPRGNMPVVMRNKFTPNGQQKNTIPTSTKSMVKNFLSACAAWYMYALVFPFYPIDGLLGVSAWWKRNYGMDPAPACIPTYPASPSRKLWQITRINALSNQTNGGLACMVAPTRLANDYATTFDSNCPIIITGQTWGGNGTVFPTCDSWGAVAPAVGVNMTNVQSEFAQADLAFVGTVDNNNVVKYRLVAFGFRIKYEGTTMNRSGTLHCVHTPNHESLSGLAVTYLSNTPSYFQVKVTEEWTTLQYAVVDPEEIEYKMDGIVNAGSVGVQNAPNVQLRSMLNHYLGFMVFGSTVNSPFAIEFIQHFEIIGPNIVGKTKSDVDPNGMGVVGNVVSPATAPLLAEHPQTMETMGKEVPMTVSDLGNSLLNKGVEVGGKLLSKGIEAGITSIFV